jgi:hypothetical protein
MSDNENKSEDVPDSMRVGVYKGRVILYVSNFEGSIALDPAQAIELANSIFNHATSIDGTHVNDQLQNNPKMLNTYARMLYGAAGMYLTSKSAVGLADHNESVGLAVRLLCQEAELSLPLGPKRKGGDNHGQPETN